jgi:citrate lyase beta subunit
MIFEKFSETASKPLVFSPSLEEVNYARRVISAYAKAREDGKSLAVLDGKLIEYLHVQEATATIRSFDDIHRVA